MGAEISTKSFDVRIREDCTKKECLKLPVDLEKKLKNMTKSQIYELVQYYSICDFNYCKKMYGDDLYNYRLVQLNRMLDRLGVNTISNSNSNILRSQIPRLPEPGI